MDRREFLKTAGAAGAAPVLATVAPRERVTEQAGGSADREYWIRTLRRVADPVLENLANGTLKTRMPVEQAAGADRRSVTHLEALGRLVAGIAPWIELPADETAEGKLRQSVRRSDPSRHREGGGPGVA